MVHVHCFAVIPDAEQRRNLLFELRHHGIVYLEDRDKVSVDIDFASLKSAESLIELFDKTDSNERGFTIIEEREE